MYDYRNDYRNDSLKLLTSDIIHWRYCGLSEMSSVGPGAVSG